MILLGLVSIVWDLGVIDIKFYCFKNNHFYKKKKKSGFQECNEFGVLVVWQSRQWQAGSELSSVNTSLFPSKCKSRVEVLQSSLYTCMRKSSMGLEADDCV